MQCGGFLFVYLAALSTTAVFSEVKEVKLKAYNTYKATGDNAGLILAELVAPAAYASRCRSTLLEHEKPLGKSLK